MTMEQRRAREAAKIERQYLTDLVDGVCDGCGREGKVDREDNICTQCTACALSEIESGELDSLLD